MNATQAIQWKLSSAELVQLTQLVKTVAAAGTPERATATQGTYFRQATFLGRKAVRTANVGIVYLGPLATNDAQPYDIPANGEITITAPIGCKYDLYDFFVDVLNDGDGVVVLYA